MSGFFGNIRKILNGKGSRKMRFQQIDGEFAVAPQITTGDIAAIAEDAARRQAESNRPVWQPSTTNQAMHPSGESGGLPVDKPSPATG